MLKDSTNKIGFFIFLFVQTSFAQTIFHQRKFGFGYNLG